ncbi:MAG: NAD(P)-dependent oxidoreductase [Actinobacteria bacterium]|nr:NAD(P)-dependent oxidoreductase [Actinomycetota bacterium]
MRVLLAGASGVVGRPLTALLAGAGHDVVGTTRSRSKAEAIRAAGAEPAIVDALDLPALEAVVAEARPEVVINQLTALPDALDFRDPDSLAATNRLRSEVGPALARMAAEAGARRLIAQSVAFFYAPVGDRVVSEDAPLMELPDGSPMAAGPPALRELERSALETPGIEGVILRYGYFYGPGTYYAADGSIAEQVRKRRFPVIGAGTGVFSFIHVDDAAAATLAALERGAPGAYNVSDDEPAPMSEWLPAFAEAIGAKRPRRVPVCLARLFAGKEAAGLATELRGASNAKARRELGWAPRYASWRQGFREALG